MMNQLLNAGLEVVVSQLNKKIAAKNGMRDAHPLAGYPILLSALDRAERSGALAAERRKLSHHTPIGGARMVRAVAARRPTLTVTL